jgi:iron(III) transport system substrate-binding protein
MRVFLPDLKGVSAALVLAASSAVHTAHSQALQKLAAYQGEDRQQRLAEGARKEGSLLFYATFPLEYADQLIEPFRSKYGIKVEYWRARSEIVLRKVIAEARANTRP